LPAKISAPRIVAAALASLTLAAGVAHGAGQTPGPGQTPGAGKTPGQTPGRTPGQTPGQTPGSGSSANAHAPVCPSEAHIRLPQNTSFLPDGQARFKTVVWGNCSDPDGQAATAALTYSSPGVFPQHIHWDVADQGAQDITHISFLPEFDYTGPDFMQYYAIDQDKHTYSNTTDFYIEVVAGLTAASAVWTGTSSPDNLKGTELADTINSLGGDDTIVDTSSAAAARSVATAAKARPKRFVNVIDAGRGNDRINVANRKRDRVRCGPGKDRVTADRRDKLSGCEKVKRRK
jgi:hypothetical protein